MSGACGATERLPVGLVWEDLGVSTLRTGLVVIVVAMAGLLAGCGSGHLVSSPAQTTPSSRAASADAAAAKVIRGWARALRSGDVDAAADYFALPSIFSNADPGPLEIRTEREARFVNASLSCGALITSITAKGKYFAVAFRLTGRTGPGAGCGSGAGASAAVDFVIKDGHIVDWIRAPAPGTGPPKIPTPTTPGQPV